MAGLQIARLGAAPLQIPGDTNHDGKVDETDTQTLAANWGTSTTAGASAGDFNSDGIVDAGDASIMAANWGDHTGEATESVPEPSMLALLMVVPLALLALRRR